MTGDDSGIIHFLRVVQCLLCSKQTTDLYHVAWRSRDLSTREEKKAPLLAEDSKFRVWFLNICKIRITDTHQCIWKTIFINQLAFASASSVTARGGLS